MSYIFDEPENQHQRNRNGRTSPSEHAAADHDLLIADLRHAVYSAVPQRSESELRTLARQIRERAEQNDHLHEEQNSSENDQELSWSSRGRTALVVGSIAGAVGLYEWLVLGSLYSPVVLVALAAVVRVWSDLSAQRGVAAAPVARRRAGTRPGRGSVPSTSEQPARLNKDTPPSHEVRERRQRLSPGGAVLAAGAAVVTACLGLLLTLHVHAADIPEGPLVVPVPTSTTVAPPGSDGRLQEKAPGALEMGSNSSGAILQVATTAGGTRLYVNSDSFASDGFREADAQRAIKIAGNSYESPRDEIRWRLVDRASRRLTSMTLAGLHRDIRSNNGVWVASISYSWTSTAQADNDPAHDEGGGQEPRLGPNRDEPGGTIACDSARVDIDPRSGRVISVSPRSIDANTAINESGPPPGVCA